ncbi:S-adenosyl-L-methionine-dependent methyltransferase [Radiomyces spectabilis]|uniref:S-adenosyl-L-methionine-dependent methyltransferase n=1 Tax=Radiomyces spectabilis TaxID=64574 RepID=UPI00221F68F6|nr:S-adenosyl-L-methionine-dependent methyltransferase [Radiomyces spectabilis]KAI8379324.1 S-adenosyl-L-methionine-dependent methyltransferase [Radiomyces spectabilis]
MSDSIRCLEFFSGIGGLHYAVNIAGVDAQVIAAFDVNEIANKVYEHNFKKKPLNKTIERLTPNDIAKYKADCWLLSPPCQPYTQGGREKDCDDPRAKPLMHLIDLLPRLADPPRYLFLENVKNFESSQSRRKLVEQLDALGYEIHECLLSPIQFGIPNHRLRYYLTARRCHNTQAKNDVSDSYVDRCTINTTWPFSEEAHFELPELSIFLQPEADDDERYKVPFKDLKRLHNFRLDIVRPDSRKTSCVTKSYGSHHIMTSGSMMQTKKLEITEYDWSNSESLTELGLRFLTPTEIARLHAFPLEKYHEGVISNTTSVMGGCRPFIGPTVQPYLEFPSSVTIGQRYRLLGNSLNCWVVAELLRCHLFQR